MKKSAQTIKEAQSKPKVRDLNAVRDPIGGKCTSPKPGGPVPMPYPN